FMSPLQTRSPVVLLPLCLRFLTVQLGSAIGVGGCFDADCSGVMHCMVCTGSPIPGIFTPICFIMAASSADSCGIPFIFTVTAMSHWPALSWSAACTLNEKARATANEISLRFCMAGSLLLW